MGVIGSVLVLWEFNCCRFRTSKLARCVTNSRCQGRATVFMRILEDWAWYKVTVKALGTDLENLSAPLPNRRTPKSISPMFHVAPASHFSQHHPQGIPYARPPMHQRQPSLVPGAPTKGLVVNMQLPRSLKRPPYNEVSSDHIAAVAPELKDVPPEYVRKTLSQKASS